MALSYYFRISDYDCASNKAYIVSTQKDIILVEKRAVLVYANIVDLVQILQSF